MPTTLTAKLKKWGTIAAVVTSLVTAWFSIRQVIDKHDQDVIAQHKAKAEFEALKDEVKSTKDAVAQLTRRFDARFPDRISVTPYGPFVGSKNHAPN